MTRLLGILACAAAVLAGAGGLNSPAPRPIVPHLEVEGTSQIEAGGALELVVKAAVADGTRLRAVFFSAYRTVEIGAAVNGGRAVLMAPPDVTAVAGRLDIAVQVGWTWATTAVDLTSGDVVEPPVPMVGSRSVVAGDEDRSMVVVIPVDRLGNPVVDEGATVRTRWPDGVVAVIAMRRGVTLQWGWIPSRRMAGPALVTATAGSVPGPERTLRVVPAAIEDLDFEITTEPGRADGVSFIDLKTSPLTDRFGNPVLDGTAVVVETVTPGGARSFQTATTVNGVARARLEVGVEPGRLEIVVSSGGVTARRTVELSPAVAVTVPPVAIEVRPGPDLVRVGPVVGDLGQLVPDGTPVTVVTPSAGTAVVGLTRSGVAALSVELGDADTIDVSVGGAMLEVRVDEGP